MPRQKNANLPTEGRGSGYSKEVRDRVHALLKEGKSPMAAGRELGIRTTTIWTWYRNAGKSIPKESMEAYQAERKQALEQARERYRNMPEAEKAARKAKRQQRKSAAASTPQEQQTTLLSPPSPPALPPASRPPPSSNGAPPGYVQTFMPNSETAIAEALRTALDERDALKRTLEIYQRENDALKRRLNEGR